MPAMYLISQASFVDGATSISFTSIPQTYKHLKLVASVKGNGNSGAVINVGWRINNSSGGNYSTQLRQVSSSTYGFVDVSNYNNSTNAYTAALLSDLSHSTAGDLVEFYIPNYTTTSYYKSMIVRWSSYTNLVTTSTQNQFNLGSYKYAGTGAVESFDLYDITGYAIDSPSFFYLYGIEG